MSKYKYQGDDFLISQGRDLFTSAKSAREMVDQDWSDELDLYNNEFLKDEKKYSDYLGIKRLFIPKTYTNTQRIVVESIDTFLFDPDNIVSVSSDKAIPYENQEAVKVLLNYRLNGHPINFFQESYEASLDAVRNKVGIFKVYPQLKTAKLKESQKVNNEDGTTYDIEYEDESVTDYSPRIECVPPEDVFFHPMATWKNYHQFPIVHRYFKSRDYCSRMGFKNVDTISAINDGTFGDQTKIKRDEFQLQSPFSNTDQVKEQDLIAVYECWDFLPDKKGNLESCSYILLGDQAGPVVVARGWERNELPYKFDEFEYNRSPFILGVAYPESHRLYGKSYPEITASLQIETNAQRNQEREAVARALRPPVYLNKDSNVDLMSLVNRRIGGFVQGTGPAHEAIAELQTMNPMAITAAHQARTDADYYETGIPPNLLGTGSSADTATDATQKLNNANKKLAMIIKSLAYTLFIPSFRYLLRLEQTYCSDEFVNMVTGKMLGWKLPNDQYPAKKIIQGEFDLKVNLGLNKQAQINKWLMMLDRANQMNQVIMGMVQSGVVNHQQTQFFNPIWMFEQMLNLLGLKSSEEYKIPAMQPAPSAGRVPGIASQPRNPADASQAVNQMSPEATGAINVI